MTTSATHPAISVTVDVVLFCMYNATLNILLIERKYSPYAGAWALPGGFVDAEESLEQAARRELFEETGINKLYIQQFHTFGDPGRDPRRQTISVAYIGLCHNPPPLQTSDETPRVEWHPISKLPTALAFDHQRIVELARTRLMTQLQFTTIAGELLPPTFTIAEIHGVYEQIVGESLNLDIFARAIHASPILHPDHEHPHHLFRINRDHSDGHVAFRWYDARQSIA
ncbi:MAG: NUDIX hydrolase [Chloroflexales bacterium]|nr:NUDIX hydrolase [Chloroflexales bacterium]